MSAFFSWLVHLAAFGLFAMLTNNSLELFRSATHNNEVQRRIFQQNTTV